MSIPELIQRLTEIYAAQAIVEGHLRQHPANLAGVQMALTHAQSLTLKLREDLAMRGLSLFDNTNTGTPR